MNPARDAPDPTGPLRLPLWVHQVVEYGVGLVLVYQSVHSADAPQLAAAGLLTIVLAAFTDAGAGALRWIPPLLHRTLDVLMIAVLLLAPFVFGVGDPVAIVLCVGGATTLGWLHWHTRWLEPAKRTWKQRLRGALPRPTASSRKPERPTAATALAAPDLAAPRVEPPPPAGAPTKAPGPAPLAAPTPPAP
ncbi:MAG: hypothetical protein JWL73_83, partial [Actinomycetia bacterium]|nr:hypothetical protein [Actinomycetes bacterium]